MSFDTIITAIGQQPEISEQFGLPVGRGNTIQIKPDTIATDREGIFAGGDAVTGPASVIEAIAAGRQAATSIDKHLGGNGVIAETLSPPEEAVTSLKVAEKSQRPPVPALPLAERLGSFTEVELGMSEEAAIEEAGRCLNCDFEECLSDQV